MRAAELAEERCSIATPASLLGDRWTLVILRQCFNGIKRFEDFQSTLGISRSLLSERLGRLVDAGVLRREPYKDAVPNRDRYRLTEMGLRPLPRADGYAGVGRPLHGRRRPPIEVRHKGCGGEPPSSCAAPSAARRSELGDAEAFPGPGLKVLDLQLRRLTCWRVHPGAQGHQGVHRHLPLTSQSSVWRAWREEAGP